MPLKKEWKKVMASMMKTYKSPKKAKNVFYAMINAGKLSKKKMEGKKKK